MNVYCTVCDGEMEILEDLGTEIQVAPCGCVAALRAEVEAHRAALAAAHGVMQKVRDEIPETAYFAIITLVPEWVDTWDKVKAALPSEPRTEAG